MNKIRVERLSSGPVVRADMVKGYGAVFNAGLLVRDGIYYLIARGVREGYLPGKVGGVRFINYISDILVFTSTDGEHYEFGYVLAKAGDNGVDCFEDPRVSVVVSSGEHIVMTFTNLFHSGFHCVGACELSWEEGRLSIVGDSLTTLGPKGVANKDAVVFNLANNRVGMLQRLYNDVQIAVFDDLEALFKADESYWDAYCGDIDRHVILRPSQGALGIGAGAPPIDIGGALALFYHERQENGTYTMNICGLDPENGRVKVVVEGPVLAPETPWEKEGDVNNVVFVQGAARRSGDVYLVYGAADKCVGAALVDLEDLRVALV